MKRKSSSLRAESSQLSLPLPMGARLLEELQHHPSDEVRQRAVAENAEAIFNSVEYVMDENPISGFLHSALCAMSLPVRSPKDEFAPIIRRDGNYTLVIRPTERMKMVDGELVPTKVGVPYGVHARLVMLFIMTEAVKLRSREIYLGNSFAAWLRRMGIMSTNSGGARGSRALVQDQIDRLMSCEWTIRWDETVAQLPADKGTRRKARKSIDNSISAFSVNDMRMVNQYGGVATEEGEFVSRFVLSEPFYETLLKHSVPLNERAFAALKKSATQIDLYTYLAYRLPRIKLGDEVKLRWEDLRAHLGNESSTAAKFRQTVRMAWETVSGVYQQARGSVDLDKLVVKLRYAPAPIDRQMVKRCSGLIDIVSAREEVDIEGKGRAGLLEQALRFPKSGSIRWGTPELLGIAKEHGSNNDVDIIANAFRKAIGEDIEGLEGDRLVLRFTAFCKSFKRPQ